MHRYGKEELYEAVKDMLGREEFEEKMSKEIEEYGELIDEDTAAIIVVDKLKSDFFNATKISELEDSTDVTLYARVELLGKTRKFDKGRVVNVVISDGTHSCMLVLWDKDVGLVESRKIREGQVIKIINGYVKDGYYGMEINIGKWGLVETEPGNAPGIKKEIKPAKLSEIKKGIANIEVRIKKIHPTRIFFTENGERFAASILAEDESGERRMILWDEMARSLQKFKEGDTIRIDRAYVKNGEMHAGEISSIESKR